jgi:hypothetical protein
MTGNIRLGLVYGIVCLSIRIGEVGNRSSAGLSVTRRVGGRTAKQGKGFDDRGGKACSMGVLAPLYIEGMNQTKNSRNVFMERGRRKISSLQMCIG